nr:lanthionine synthetase LanC family protein [Coxiella burnetii]
MALLTIATDHLLTQYPEPDKLPDSLENKYSDQPLLGFSHGIAGFTWALAKANEFLHDKKIESWIKNALAYERCRFDAKKITGRMFAPPFVSTPKPIINL